MNAAHHKPFGLKSGMGLVIANMVGAGVFLSSGFMAQELAPGPLLLAWALGAVLALCGARAYAEVARLVLKSGGEYRYLSELLHPALGYLAGWASLLVGFSAPIAMDALAAGAFVKKLVPALNPTLFAVLLIAALSVFHAIGLRSSARLQNGLVTVKVALLLGFLAVGLLFGTVAWPTWSPPSAPPEGTTTAFINSLFYIALAFSGWNAAIYASEEFERPERDVPRAMLWGCAAVALLYLAFNYIFIANLTPAEAFNVRLYDDEQVTLGHVVIERLLGHAPAQVMSAVLCLLFISATSAMVLLGPRVYSAMARDGFLPKALEGQPGAPPKWSLVLQGLIALAVVLTHHLKDILWNVGAILTLFSALTTLGLFRVWLKPRAHERKPALLSLICAAVFASSAGLMFYIGFRTKLALLGWVGVVATCGFAAYTVTRRLQRSAA
ncbi:MAG: APC family permease [Myxococcaceae bacterium]|nr:APC family permease [Myxococcaceae bacterium]